CPTPWSTRASGTTRRSMAAAAFPELRRVLGHKGAVAGGALLLVIGLGAGLAPRLAPYDPIAPGPRAPLPAPGGSPPPGPGVFGRDILSRVTWGGRASLRVGLLAVAVSATLGTLLGLVAGYYEGWTGAIVLRLTDVLLALPGILLALTIVAATGPSLENV